SDLRRWCRGKISAYKIPRQLKVLDALPRNAMGKVTKPELASLLLAVHTAQDSPGNSH
ncbi:MAG: hypothetical protein HKN70_06060, partial [Gammaproteobacteria bacterium]|nr:hypothetical protein [Gammaproteobacteria bacterium]